MRPIYRYVIDGVEYPNFRAAALTYNLTHDKLNGRLKNKDYPSWLKIRISDNQVMYKAGSQVVLQPLTQTIKIKETKPKAPRNKNLIYVDGVEYKSIVEVVETFGITRDEVVHKLKSANYPNWTKEGVSKEVKTNLKDYISKRTLYKKTNQGWVKISSLTLKEITDELK